jgi:hypothetical protein
MNEVFIRNSGVSIRTRSRRAYVVQRRVLNQVLKVRLVVRAAVVRHPRVADRELLEPQHV